MRFVLAPALVFIATSLDRGYQTDLWQHLARGRVIAQERAIVSVDRFTFTAAGEELCDNNWLTQLLYYVVHSVAGLEGVQLVNSLALAATFALLVAHCRRTSGSTGVAAAAGVGAFLGLWPTLLIRPQTFSMLLFVAMYGLLEAARARPRLLLWGPAIMALWANVHGGFGVGLVLMFGLVLGDVVGARLVSPCAQTLGDTSVAPTGAKPYVTRQSFSLLACLVLSTLATLANPYGWNVYRYAGKLSAVGVARGIEEWLPPSLGSLNGSVFGASLALFAVLVFASSRRPTARELCLLACFAVPACFSTRMTVWWFLAAAPVMARLAAGLALCSAPPKSCERGASHASPFAAAALATIAAAAVLSLPWLEHYHPAMRTVRSAHRVETDLQTIADSFPVESRSKVFTRMEWANYLTWCAPERSSVFVEGHVELYPDDTWRRFLAVTEGRPGWETVLDQYGVDYLLLDEPYHAALIERATRSPQWSRQMQAGSAVLFKRREGVAPSVAGTDF